MYVKGIRKLFKFPKYMLEKISLNSNIVQAFLRHDRRFRIVCPYCGKPLSKNRVVYQTARDLPLGTAIYVILTYEAIQGYCTACGEYHTFHPSGINPHARVTDRLMAFVSQLCRYMPLVHAAEIVGIPAATVYRWDKRWLASHLPEPDLDNLRILIIDEKSVRKRHGYVTLVMNGETGELLHMAEGKKKQSLQSFFDKLTKEQKAGITAVAIDRAGAYHTVVTEQLPQADIVYDKFHLIKNYNDLIDQVRRQEWRRANEEDKKVIKGQRYNLFRNPENRTEKQTLRLKALLKLNENLNRVYVLKEAFHHLWTYTYRASAEKYLLKWISWAKETEIEPLLKFAKSLLKSKDEVLNYFKHRITTGRLEGFNNTVSRIVHRACGVQNLDYLFLKLRQESLEVVLQK